MLYWCFYLFGFGALTPWSALVSSVDYFEDVYPVLFINITLDVFELEFRIGIRFDGRLWRILYLPFSRALCRSGNRRFVREKSTLELASSLSLVF